MSVVDIIQSVGVIVTIIFSVIGMVQAGKANRDAKKALNDSQKDYMPLIKLVEEITCESKGVEELCGGITFDFCGGIICDDSGELSFDKEDRYIPISLEIQNVGKGIIRKMIVSSFLICYGNKNVFDIKLSSDDEVDIILYEPDYRCEQEFMLCEGEKEHINILFPQSEYRIDTKKISEIVRTEDVFISMEIKLFSTNESAYHQRFLWCNYEKGAAKRSSFDDVIPFAVKKLKERQR